ncbi:hypothetical protein TNCV_4788231 [Trichonephila clavipes]|nr:hypothetical protein TNCV_4788231 [Trichonephila clavipes]
MVQNYEVRRPRVAEQCDVNIHSPAADGNGLAFFTVTCVLLRQEKKIHYDFAKLSSATAHEGQGLLCPSQYP